MKHLDKLDRRILFELDRNSRRSYSQLARVLRDSRDRIEYRTQRLKEEGLIRKCTLSIDLCRIGLRVYKTYIRLENNRPRVAEFMHHVKKHPRVYWFATSEGSWDLMFVVAATDARDFHQVHTKILSDFNEVILNFSSYSLVDLRFYGRGYLAPTRDKFTYDWGERSNQTIDTVDLDILHALASDARMPISELAERTNIAPHLARYRIQRMEDQRIIIGYHVDLDLKRLGILSFKTQLYLRSYDISLYNELVEFCRRSPHIICYIQQVGDCNVEIEMEVEDLDQHYAVIEEIRGNYSKLIRNFQSFLLRDAAFTSVPAYLRSRVSEARGRK